MKNILTKLKEKDKKAWIILIVLVLLLVGGISGGTYLYLEEQYKQGILNAMKVEFNEEKNQIEYGSEFDSKELVSKLEGGTITEYPTVDTMKVGDATLTFTVSYDGLTKDFKYDVSVVDTKAPEISFKEDSITITEGEDINIEDNINSVKDVVDGDIKKCDKDDEFFKKALEDYKALNVEVNKEDEKADEDTEISKKSETVDTSKITLNGVAYDDFMIEPVKDKEKDPNIYLKNTYVVKGSVDKDIVGEYTITVTAIDLNGNKSEKSFKVTVEEKEVEPTVAYNGGTSYSSGYSSGTASGGGTSGGSTASVAKGSVADVIATAQSLDPNAYSCHDFLATALSANGYSLGNLYSAGYSVGTNIFDARPGDLIVERGGAHILMVAGSGYKQYDEIDRKEYYILPIVEGGLSGNNYTVRWYELDGTPHSSNDWISDIRRIF